MAAALLGPLGGMAGGADNRDHRWPVANKPKWEVSHVESEDHQGQRAG